MSTLEYHVMLALANGALHGYAIKDAVASESDGVLTPLPATLYRVVARLMTEDLVAEVEPAGAQPPHPGLPRRYYALTAAGRRALAAEARRLKVAARLAETRLGTTESRP